MNPLCSNIGSSARSVACSPCNNPRVVRLIKVGVDPERGYTFTVAVTENVLRQLRATMQEIVVVIMELGTRAGKMAAMMEYMDKLKARYELVLKIEDLAERVVHAVTKRPDTTRAPKYITQLLTCEIERPRIPLHRVTRPRPPTVISRPISFFS